MEKIIKFLTPQWVSKEWNPGSMGAAEKKGNIRFFGIMTLALIVVYSMVYFNLFNTYMSDYFTHGGAVGHFISYVLAVGSIWLTWKIGDFDHLLGTQTLVAIVVLMVIASVGFGAGWDFSLRGIE